MAPIAWGLLGLVAAGMIGAILSSLDSMMNPSATIVTFDLYQRYMVSLLTQPDEEKAKLTWVGQGILQTLMPKPFFAQESVQVWNTAGRNLRMTPIAMAN